MIVTETETVMETVVWTDSNRDSDSDGKKTRKCDGTMRDIDSSGDQHSDGDRESEGDKDADSDRDSGVEDDIDGDRDSDGDEDSD